MKVKKEICRKCVSCGDIIPKEALIRIARDKDGTLSLDKTGHMKGRGAYICLKEACVEKAFKKNCLERSFRAGIDRDRKAALFEEIRGFEGEKGGSAIGACD